MAHRNLHQHRDQTPILAGRFFGKDSAAKTQRKTQIDGSQPLP